jgi:hypothetical protein
MYLLKEIFDLLLKGRYYQKQNFLVALNLVCTSVLLNEATLPKQFEEANFYEHDSS